MLSSPKTVASHWDTLTSFESSRRRPAGHASPHTPLVGGGVAAATGAEEAQSAILASPPPVLISECQVMFATAAAGAASQNAATRRPRFILLWQWLSLHSDAQRQPHRKYPPRRPSYLERTAAMAREMGRL
jgi:hypothetical protein